LPIVLQATSDPDLLIQMEKNSRAKHWCFTINNPDLEADKKTMSEAPDIKYCVMQLERGEDGTLHLQGVIGFDKQKWFNTLKHLHQRAHWEVSRSVPKAVAYCRKEETRVEGPWEYGEVPVAKFGKQGKRSDLDKVTKYIRKGHSPRMIFDKAPTASIRYFNNIAKLCVMFTPPRDFASRVYLFYGETGTKKTTSALELFKNPFKVLSPKHGNLWFDGYDPMFHETVVFDDFYGGIKWGELLQICDRHPFLVQVKGASVQFRPKTIIFTSNSHYISWYPKMDHAALKRRFEEFGGVILFKKEDGHVVRELELGSFPDELRSPSPDNSEQDDPVEQPHDIGNHQEMSLNAQSSESE